MKKILLCLLFLLPTLFYAQVNNMEHCAGNNTFDLTLQKPLLIGNLNPAETTVSYHVSLADANNNLNAIADPSNFVYTGNIPTIYARIDNNGVITTNYFNLIVNPVLIANATVAYVNCVPRIVISGSGGNSNYEYSHAGVTYTQNNIINNPSPGSQTVYIRDGNGCVASKTLNVEALSPLSWRAQTVGVTCPESSNGSIEITALGGKAPYLFSIGNEFISSSIFKNLKAGEYTATIQDATGCTNSFNFNILPINPVIAASTIITNDSNATNEGKIELNVSGGVPPYNYSLKNDKGVLIPYSTANFFTGLAAGSYDVIVTDSQGCTLSQKDINILNAPTPLTTTFAVTPITCIITTGTLTITPNGGTLPYQYSIDNGNNYSNSNVFSNLVAGTYNIMIRDAQGSVISAIATVEPVKLPVITTTTKSILCHGDSNGSILVGASNGKSPNLFSINGGAYTPYNLFENLSAGTYVLSVKDSNGCIVSTTVTLDNPAPITANITYADRTVTVTASGGYGKYDYALDSGTYGSSNRFLNVTYGNHIIYVKDPNNCILAQPISVVKPVPLASSFTIDKGTVTINTTGGVSPYRYALQKATGFPIITTESNVFTDLVNGSYKIFVNDSQGNSLTLFDVIISESIALTASATSTPINCNGIKGTITATATGGKSPYQYSLDSNNFSNSNVFSNLNANNYSVTVRDSNNFTTTTSVTVSNAPSVLITAEILAETTCFGTNEGIIKVTAIQGQAPYSYAIDNTNFQSSDTFRNLSPGIHTIQVLDKNNCTSSVSVTLAAPLRIDAAISINDHTIIASVTGGTSPYTYSLLNNNGLFTGPQASSKFENLPSGLYSLQIVDKKGCSIVRNDINISETSVLSATATISPISCENSKGTITVTATGGTGSYEYSLNNNPSYSPSNVFSDLSPGNYTISVRDSENAVTTISAAIIAVNPLAASATLIKNIDCVTNASINVTVQGGKRPYLYSLDNGQTYTENNTFTNLNAGIYFVRVKDSLDCVAITNTIAIEQLAYLNISASHVDTSAFNSNDGSITVLPNGGTAPYTYSLLNSDNIIVIFDQLSNTFYDLTSGNYSVVVKDANGCTSQMMQVVSSAPASTLLATASIIQPGCSNPAGMITVTASGGFGNYQYSIDNGKTYTYSNVFTVFEAGNYTIFVRDSENAIYNFNVVILPLNPIILTASIISMPSCINNGMIMVDAIGGQPSLSYSINGSTFQQSNIFANLSPGVYSITARDTNECMDTVYITLPSPALLVATVTVENQTITVTATGGSGAYQYSIDGSVFQSSTIFTNLPYGVHQVFVRDLNGCIEVVIATVNPPAPLLEGEKEITIAFKSGQTLGDLIIKGENIKWYSSKSASTGKTSKTLETPLPLTTLLVDGVTYYASQTIDGIESTERLAVTAKVNGSLSAPDFVLPNFKYYPNPVQHTLTISNTSDIEEIEIIAVSGKSVLTKKINNTHSDIDLSNISSGFYFLKVTSEGKTKTIKIVKK